MRWDRFFDDLEDQLSSEWEAERAALDTEAERLRLSRVALRDRLSALTERDPASAPATFELSDGTVMAAEVSGLGADWLALQPVERRAGAILAPLASVVSIGMPHAELLRTARPLPTRTALSERMTLGFVLRDLVRRRVFVTVGFSGGRLASGTIDRAGADHLDIALHDAGTSRRADAVTGYRLVPFSSMAWIRLEAGAAIA